MFNFATIVSRISKQFYKIFAADSRL